MRTAVIITLQTLYESNDEVSSFRSEERLIMTRITNEFKYIRNRLGIEVITDIVRRSNVIPYEKYRLKRSKENLKKVNKIFTNHPTKKPLKKAVR